ncbi:hypothetical protein BSKO_11901 [Bryopsis sp. KO-2023]|nr:hypothetical protein BSKO_11901 [Bryopsis sp. KO-2023]
MREQGNPFDTRIFGRQVVEQAAGQLAGRGSAAFPVSCKEMELEKIGRRMQGNVVNFPSVAVEFRGLRVEVEARVRSQVSPAIPQATRSFLRGMAGMEKHPTRKQTVLKEVSGVMQPGRMTLLLGPPGSGKSVLMETLAGRESDSLQVSGEITYNGVPLSGCIPQRTTSHMSDYDQHLANLTVRETLQFSHRCQNGDRSPWASKFFASKMRDLSQIFKRMSSFKRMPHDQEDRENEEIDHPTASTPSALASIEEQGESSMRGGLSNCKAILGGLVDIDSLNDYEFSQFLEEIWNTQVKMELVIKQLGLSHCLDCYMKKGTVDGISPGEFKRVSIAEALMGPRTVLFLDNFSTDMNGDILRSELKILANATHALRLTTTVVLKDPDPETLFLFDDVLLLTDGNIVYHGPVQEAISFFESLGFSHPIGREPASFMMQITTPQGQAEFATDELRERIAKRELEGDISPMPIPLTDMVEAFQNQCEAGLQEAALLGSPFRRMHGHHLALPHDQYAFSHFEGFLTLFRRQLVLSIRGYSAISSLFAFLVLGLAVGTAFWGLQSNPMEKGSNFLGGSFALLYSISIAPFAQVSSFHRQTKVFHKQFGDGYFPALVFSWSMALGQIPLAIAKVGLFATPTYLLMGLSTDSAKQFFIYFVTLLLVYLSTMAVSIFITALWAAGTRSYSCINLFMLVSLHLSGFSLTRTAIPRAWIWVYWLMPFAWAERAILINEWKSSTWDETDMEGCRQGDAFLRTYGIPAQTHWIWRAAAYLVFVFVSFTTLTAFILTYSHRRNRNRRALARDSAAVMVGKTLQQMNALVLRGNGTKIMTSHHKSAESEGLPFPPILLAIKNISFAEKSITATGFRRLCAENRCVYDVSGFAAPGTVTAILSEPTDVRRTLLKVLAGRKPNSIASGQILANGKEVNLSSSSWARSAGYVDKTDVFCETATIGETLAFTGRLRLDTSIPKSRVKAMIRMVLDLVGMSDMQTSFIGPSLSAQQRKRLSIAEELLANPSVLLLEEPTAGLDSGGAALVMQSISNISRNGRTVLATIQQPSSEIFESFDRALLIKFGRAVYFGRVGVGSKCLVEYVQDFAPKCTFRPGDNPAAWMLKVANEYDSTMADTYKGSALFEANNMEAERLGRENATRSNVAGISGRSTTAAVQVFLLSNRFFKAYWRGPRYFASRFWATAIASIVFGTLYWGKGNIRISDFEDQTTIAALHNLLGFLTGVLTFLGVTNATAVIPVVIAERPVFFKGRSRKLFSAIAYVIAFGVVEAVYTFLQTLFFVPVVYFSARLEENTIQFFYFFAMVHFNLMIFTFVGIAAVFLMPDRAHALRECIAFLWVVFNGFINPISKLPRAWRWLQKINPIAWMLYGIATSELGKNQSMLKVLGTEMTVEEYLNREFGYDHRLKWPCLSIAFGFVLFSQILAMFVLKFARA